ncbi:MAG: hypothetical protein J6A14_01790 [Spirochaetaceae bacterium]|nr:hypothetical protein [Spirochaetaceae bacterium]
MNKIIMNLQYSTSLQCFFATLGQAACAWNHLDVNNHEIYLKTLNHEKATIEYAKKSMETMKWCSKDCLISFRKGIKEMDSYIKKTPLPWYLEEYYDYAKEEVKNFINDIKILNSKNSYYSGEIYGNP